MKILQHKVLLQYGEEGEAVTGYTKVHRDEAGMFVDVDSHSGGYPYATTIDRAYDFKTTEKALKYAGHFPGLKVRSVTITYEVN